MWVYQCVTFSGVAVRRVASVSLARHSIVYVCAQLPPHEGPSYLKFVKLLDSLLFMTSGKVDTYHLPSKSLSCDRNHNQFFHQPLGYPAWSISKSASDCLIKLRSD